MALALVMVLWGARYLATVRTILIFSWMAMLAHQVEEYGFPGGFPSIANMGVLKEKEAPNKYIFNAQQCFTCNVFFCYAFYIIAIIFPNVVWLGASQVFCVLVQLIAHGWLINRAMRWFYNPGLASTVFLQLPVAIYYIWYVATHMPDKALQLWWGIPGCIIAMFLVFILPAIIRRNRNNPYPFTEEEMYGYKKEDVLKIYNNGEPSLLERFGLHL